ncbi:MAG: alanine dehydrogenase [Flavobacteriales bacterium]
MERSTSRELAQEAALMPQEEMVEVEKKRESLFIGLPRETYLEEHRVALAPEAVALLVSNGHRVVVETNAGKDVNFQDKDYSEAGAEIVYETEEVYKADILFKVDPPTLKEIDMMKHRQTLFSALQLAVQPKDFLQRLMDKKITAIAWDFIKDKEDIFPIVRAMGEIAGNTSVLIAAEYLSSTNNGMGIMLGGISGVAPTGAGTVGEFATRAALGLGSSIKVFDNSTYRLRRLQNDLGIRLYTSVLQPNILAQALKSADVVVGAVRGKGGRTPLVVTEQMVSEMKFGSVIVDVSIDMGGCIETSEVTELSDPVFNKYGVTHYCVPNIASRVSRTASHALSNIFSPILTNIGEEGGVEELVKKDLGFRHGVYLYDGILTSKSLSEAFDLPYKDIDLLFASF